MLLRAKSADLGFVREKEVGILVRGGMLMRRLALSFASVVGSVALAACGGAGTATGGADTFSAPAPAPEWAVDVGGKGTTQAVGIAAFQDGSVLTSGAYDQDVVLGRGTPEETTLLASGGDACVFLARHDADGSLRWARAARGTSYVRVYGTAVLPNDGFVATGFFAGTARFEDGLGGESQITATGDESAFLARYAGDGHLEWLRALGGVGVFAEGLAVAAMTDNSVAVTGLFTGDMTLGALEPHETTLHSANLEAFVARFAAGGTLLWARATATAGYATAWAIAGTSDLGVVLAGELNGVTTLGDAGDPGAVVMTSETGGTDDVFVARYTATGALAWARRIGGSDNDEVLSIAAGPGDSVRVCGYFASDARVDADGIEPIAIVGHGGIDAFVAAFAVDGTPVWAHSMGGAGDDFAASVSVLTDGSTVVTGGFHGPATFDGAALTEALVLNDLADTGYDVFVVRYGLDGTLLSQDARGGLGEDMGLAVAVNEAMGTVLVGGMFSGVAQIGSGDPATLLSATGPMDAFFASLHFSFP